jgi:hypothetical protein
MSLASVAWNFEMRSNTNRKEGNPGVHMRRDVRRNEIG